MSKHAALLNILKLKTKNARCVITNGVFARFWMVVFNRCVSCLSVCLSVTASFSLQCVCVCVCVFVCVGVGVGVSVGVCVTEESLTGLFRCQAYELSRSGEGICMGNVSQVLSSSVCWLGFD
jgi:hypothetical protein